MKAPTPPSPSRQRRGTRAYHEGLDAEHRAIAFLEKEGYTVLAHRLRTPLGEIDLIVTSPGWIVAVEVKQRRSLNESLYALSSRQSQRLLSAFHLVLEMHPEWHQPNTRFDVVLVDASGLCHKVEDALRLL